MAVAVGCGKKDSGASAKSTNTLRLVEGVTSEVKFVVPLTAPVDYLGAVGQAKKHSEGVIDRASLQKTIDLFNAQEDRFPKDLNELVTMKYLPAIPPAPYGMKIQYDAASGQVKIVKAQ
jgi:hypothetical protein